MAEVNQGERILIKADGSCVIEKFSVREPNPDEVLIETVNSLISAGTELGNQEVSRSDFYPGYSNAGRIIAVGKDVRGLSIGDRVLSLGNHATHVTVPAKPEEVALIPDNVSFDHVSFGVLGSVAINGVRKAKIELGEFVAISGMGLVGQLTLQLASQTGCESLIATDFCDLRLRIAKELGATHVCNLKTCSIREKVKEITDGLGCDNRGIGISRSPPYGLRPSTHWWQNHNTRFHLESQN
jgi:L-iditol 2-dehydrogenase